MALVRSNEPRFPGVHASWPYSLQGRSLAMLLAALLLRGPRMPLRVAPGNELPGF